jgi:HSP20 family protein
MSWMPLDTMRHLYDQQMVPLLHKITPYLHLTPRVEVKQNSSGILVIAELPGIGSRDDLHIRVQEQMITISGKIVQDEQEGEEQNLFHTERYYGPFSRSVPLPVAVDPEHVQATYRNGLLTVKMKKNTQLQGQRIPVEFQA